MRNWEEKGVSTRTTGSRVAPRNTLCIFTPGSRALPGTKGPREMKKPFGEYFGIWSNWRNCFRKYPVIQGVEGGTFSLTTAGGAAISICVVSILLFCPDEI